MGRREQRDRERKRAAKKCHTLKGFGFLSSKWPKIDERSISLPLMSQQIPEDDEESSPSFQGVEESHTYSCPATVEKTPSIPSQSPVQISDSNFDVSNISLLESQPENDIGAVFWSANTRPVECQKAVDQLSDGQKYALLKHHRRLPENLPATLLAGCMHSFQRSWLRKYPWMVYSTVVDGVFCISCALFCRNRATKGQFVNTPFRHWQKKSEKCADHQNSKFHQESLSLADQFCMQIEHPERGVVALINTQFARNIERNKHILRCIVDAILYCGRQCIALRGHRERLDTPGNHGNFLSLLTLLYWYDETLKQHLKSSSMAGVT